MSDDYEWDRNWWQQPKTTSLQRKRAAVAPAALAKPGDVFLIVTEGKVTEPVYFELLLREFKLPVVRIKILPGDASDPRHVIRTAKREAENQSRKARKGILGINEPAKFDHVWAVIDTDVAARQQFWNEVQQLAKVCKVTLAHSTPCFEYWLLLHIAGFTTRADLVDGKAAKSAVKHALGREYSTNEEVATEVIATFFSKWPEAVRHAEHARQLHRDARTPVPANPSTEVDLLIRAMNDSVPGHHRRKI